ncbi:MAG: potassium uptake protein, TrkH family, partial [Lachnospiraceae bacterium]|nr:potassium uptake protein, TrkH family [Lachnospiraceae bacterium]
MKRNPFKKLNMSQMIVLVFLAIIFVGACLLTLPVSSRSGQSIGFFNALFTATSATCVTGLSVGDTWTLFSPFGQAVMLVMIEVGGLGFMSIVSMFIFLVRRKTDFGQVLMIAQTIGTDNMRDVVRIQKRILIGSFAIEGAGAVILFFRFLKSFDPVRSAWFGLFHSVSAFCNAGFDLMGIKTPGGSVTYFGTDPTVMLTLSALIILGGLGFIVWDEIIRVRRAKRWSAYTKLVLIATGALLVLGMIGFFALEYSNPASMGDKPLGDKLLMSFFQSATTRTAGFAGVDQGALTDGGKALTIFLMFIGGSSGSTAGGLKTVTFLILLIFITARSRG